MIVQFNDTVSPITCESETDLVETDNTLVSEMINKYQHQYCAATDLIQLE